MVRNLLKILMVMFFAMQMGCSSIAENSIANKPVLKDCTKKSASNRMEAQGNQIGLVNKPSVPGYTSDGCKEIIPPAPAK
jgi:hypothetical protein